MGAAIPHLAMLSAALPPILPFASDEVLVEVKTGTVDVRDEIEPEDEDEDIEYRTRGKSSLSITMKFGTTAKKARAEAVSVQQGTSAGVGEKGEGEETTHGNMDITEDVGQPIAENV